MQLWVPPHQVLLRDHLCDLLGETGHRFLYGLTVWFHVYTETCCNDSWKSASLNEMGEQQKSHKSFSVVFTDISGSSLCGGTKLFGVKFQMCYFGVCLDAQSQQRPPRPEPGSGRGLFPLKGRSSSLLLPSSVHRGSSDC